ncbi:calcium-binding protein [Peribacillus acanthi]
MIIIEIKGESEKITIRNFYYRIANFIFHRFL